MRIVVHGQQAFGKAVLEALLKRGDEVVAVYAAPEKPGQKIDPLKEAALAAGLPVHQPASYRKPEVWEQFRALAPDGETETGLSIFWPDNGLDTGDILLQKKTPISPDDTLGSVYFDRLFPMGVAATLEAVDLVKAGKAQRVKQDESRASYEGWCSADNSRIDWGKPWAQIHDLIRGCNPQPGAWTLHDGKKLQIFDSKPLPAKQPSGIAGKMGEVVAIDAESFTVACADGRIRVFRVRAADGGKVGAAEFAAAAKLVVGTRLT